MLKATTVLLSSLLVASCATGYQPMYTYNEILVQNNSKELIQSVSITESDTGRIFSCGNIAALGICSNKFAKRRYERNPIRVEWTVANAGSQTAEIIIDVPATFYTSFALRGVLDIEADGSISAYFMQETPNN